MVFSMEKVFIIETNKRFQKKNQIMSKLTVA